MAAVTLAVLAGGEGRRMGLPKQNLEINGRPILEFLLNQFAWPGPTLLVTAPSRRHPPGANLFDAEAVDAIENQGPLRGVLTALENASTDCVIVTTVDMPGLMPEQLRWLIGRLLIRPDLHGMMLQSSVDGKNQIEPFPFACRRAAAGAIADRLAEDRRSVHSLAALPAFAVEPAPESWSLSSWINLNFPEDYQAFMRSLTG
jgi:molybdopterin-guanine dinucleotide biosynthesis protein A